MQATLNSLLPIVRARLNLTNVNTITDAEIKTFLRGSCADLYEIIANRHRDYYVTTFKLSLASGQDKYPLPPDFRTANEVYLLAGSGSNVQRILMKQFNGAEYQNYAPIYSPAWPTMYRIRGGIIEFTPVPGSDTTDAVEMFYVPQWPGIANDDASIDRQLPNGWERWVELDTCVQVAARLRWPEYYATYTREREKIEARVIAAASIRDEQPQYMVDSYGAGNWSGWRPGEF